VGRGDDGGCVIMEGAGWGVDRCWGADLQVNSTVIFFARLKGDGPL